MSGLVSSLVARGVRRAWVTDTEYKSVEGGLQIPHCLCALDLITRDRVRYLAGARYALPVFDGEG